MKVHLSLAQIQIEAGEPIHNLEKAENSLHSAIENNSSLILLPELWASGYEWQNRLEHARYTPKIIQRLSHISQKHHIYIAGSLLQERNDSQLENVFSLIQPQGQIIQYSKLHLFGLMGEKNYLIAGKQPVIAQFPWGKAGLAICYDLRFPELFRYYAFNQCQMVLILAEWPQKRIEHWIALIRARAIENQLFIAAVNTVGQSAEETFGGHSMIVAPDGSVLADCENHQDMTLTTEIDPDEARKSRQSFPVLKDYRSDIFYSYENPDL